MVNNWSKKIEIKFEPTRSPPSVNFSDKNRSVFCYFLEISSYERKTWTKKIRIENRNPHKKYID